MLWPQREVLNALMNRESGLVHEDNPLFLRDCIWLSSVSNRLNEIMRALTVIATIFILSLANC